MATGTRRRPHAEVFHALTSTGEIRVVCACERGEDHVFGIVVRRERDAPNTDPTKTDPSKSSYR